MSVKRFEVSERPEINWGEKINREKKLAPIDSFNFCAITRSAYSVEKHHSRRRGGRVAEGAGLLNQYAGNRIEGSNPSPSANHFSVNQ